MTYVYCFLFVPLDLFNILVVCVLYMFLFCFVSLGSVFLRSFLRSFSSFVCFFLHPMYLIGLYHSFINPPQRAPEAPLTLVFTDVMSSTEVPTRIFRLMFVLFRAIPWSQVLQSLNVVVCMFICILFYVFIIIFSHVVMGGGSEGDDDSPHITQRNFQNPNQTTRRIRS